MNAITRRRFLASTAAVSAVAAAPRSLSASVRTRSIGANDRLRIGLIGSGSRGIGAHMTSVKKFATEMNVEFSAVCDPWRLARENAAAKAKEWFGRDPKQFVSYRDLLAFEDVDAVMIASPDVHHTTHLEATAKAGKHVYVEKPMATDFDRLVRAVDAVKASGVVCQVGTQLRSLPGMTGARDVVQSGILGKITRVEEVRNSERPYWYQYLKDAKEEDVDWKEFLGDLPRRPYRADVFTGWYGYYDFSKGPVPGFGSHYIDLVHYMTGAKTPESCVCLGGTFYWKDEHAFTAPDQCQALWTYPEGFFVSYVTNFGSGAGNLKRLYGDKGMLKFDNWNAPTYSAEGGAKRDGSIRGVVDVKPVDRPDHWLDWLQCIRNGGTPNAPIEAGFQHAVAVIMAMTSYETGRKVVYDAKKRTMKTA